MEEALIEVVPTMRRFAGIALISDRIPDETTILPFRHLLEKHGVAEQTFEADKAYLNERGMTTRQGTIVDETLIAAPNSTVPVQRAGCPPRQSTPDTSVLRDQGDIVCCEVHEFGSSDGITPPR